ncbi:unnamed protein product [Penicillium olsonii]|uniref:Oxidoreductase-like domain-containing protein n=1 Tax=Penicillium olsonii TaxID=99116 RepID=A0A9W4HC89_PENOL|nr:unnamed protein product [Penicillium olsonii]CAG7980376.1 unnamed protein product [Penicillium olsonii]CAG8287243.1 unnamed protein product [Penicillium olsonii]
MECLSMRTGRSLQRLGLRARSLAPVPSASLISYRQYVLVPTPRRMKAHQSDQSDQSNPLNTRASLEEIPEPPAESSAQAQPLTGYYALILRSPTPYGGQAVTSRPTPRPEAAPSASVEPQTPQERMAIVFGTRLAGPGRSSRYNPGEQPESAWKTINGVPIPPQPEEPDNCCMSGCVNCVWDDFRDEMEEWGNRLATAKAKAGDEQGAKDMRSAPRAEVSSASGSMDDDGGGSEALWTKPSQDDDLFANIPVGIREFMKTEKKLRVKHQKEAAP